MRHRTTLWLLGALALAAAWSAAFTVAEGEAAVVHRFGAPRRVVDDAGLHFKWPAPIDTVARVDTRMHLLDPTPSEYLTADQRNVIVDAFLAWRVADPRSFLVRLRGREGAEASLTSALKSSVTKVLNGGPLADLLSIDARERNLDVVSAELAAEVQRLVAEADSGVAIELAGVKRVNFPQSNKDQIFERMRSDREAEAEEIRAKGRTEASEITTRATTEVAERLKAANIEAAAIRGAATARATELLAEARQRYPELVSYLMVGELFDAIQGDTEVVITSDHPLLRELDLVPAAAPGAVGAPGQGGERR